jgi:hypothetical protein
MKTDTTTTCEACALLGKDKAMTYSEARAAELCGDCEAYYAVTSYRLLVGYGDYSRPENCWGVQWATDDNGNEDTFKYEAAALLFASTVYEAKIENNSEWQSYWVYVTDSATIDEAMNEWDMRA